jgi:hypothetical protein
LRRAYERDPEAIERWKNKEYPKLKKRAKRRAADVGLNGFAVVWSMSGRLVEGHAVGV